jgi:hypothetical protein
MNYRDYYFDNVTNLHIKKRVTMKSNRKTRVRKKVNTSGSDGTALWLPAAPQGF